ncbi:uncharacterized protein DEA37_0008430 [Paragonimus westermani]|uniref:Uncharacterized protein n=1 Tax=Paragonimus westermani TaxID=34504 RepID=A0A5J4NMI2_9TREM|nr:uncharacterized protein DEA37_0008430 [Paragonimus westermani]
MPNLGIRCRVCSCRILLPFLIRRIFPVWNQLFGLTGSHNCLLSILISFCRHNHPHTRITVPFVVFQPLFAREDYMKQSSFDFLFFWFSSSFSNFLYKISALSSVASIHSHTHDNAFIDLIRFFIHTTVYVYVYISCQLLLCACLTFVFIYSLFAWVLCHHHCCDLRSSSSADQSTSLNYECSS